MKHFPILMLLLLLTSCGLSTQQYITDVASHCQSYGLSVATPNFFQRHKPDEIEHYYDCLEQGLDPTTAPSLTSEGQLTSFLTNLKYQRLLWRQVFAHEKSPSAAQTAWLEWNQRNAMISAAQDAARAADNAAWAARAPKYSNCVQSGSSINCTQY